MPSSPLETFFEVVIKRSNKEEADIAAEEIHTEFAYGGVEVREVAK